MTRGRAARTAADLTGPSGGRRSFPPVRLIVARCSVSYSGRVSTHLPEAVRLLMFKADGTFMVWADGGGPSVKPQNWMTPPTVIEEEPGRMVVRKRGGEDRLEIRVAEVLSDVTHDMGQAAALEKEGLGRCRGVLAAQQIKPQARTLAEARGIACVEVDLAVLRGEREPDLTLFAG